MLCSLWTCTNELKAFLIAQCRFSPKMGRQRLLFQIYQCFCDLQCSVSCSTGVQTREVMCSWNTVVDCDPQAKPASVKPCNIQDCPTNMDSDWSGSGSSSKEVFNEINTILEDNHLLKSPKGASKGNSRIEGDFSHNNEIEVDKSIKSNILVDDFYYDYNFIKFHEDLSYDFDGEGNEASDHSGIHSKQESKPNRNKVYREGTSPSTTTSYASNTMVPPTAADSRSPQFDQPDERDSEEDIVLAEDYFLPVGTTAKPRSPITGLSQIYDTLDVPTQDSDPIQSMLPTDEVPSEVTLTPDDAISSIKTGYEPDNDLYRGTQTDSNATRMHGSQKENKDGTTSTTVEPVTSQLNVDIGAKVETPMEHFSNLDQSRITTPAPLPAWSENRYNESVPSAYPSQSPNSQPQATSDPLIVPLLPSTAFWTTSNWSAVSSSSLHEYLTLRIKTNF